MRITAAGTAVLIAGLSILLSSCSSKPEKHEPVTLTIAGVHPDWFLLEYGEQLVIDGQEINVKVVPYDDIPMDEEGEIEYDKLYGQFSPDIVAFGRAQTLKPMIEEGLLMPLDSLAKKSGQLDSIVPMVMSKIRGAGDGQLYAWPAEYNTEALFYNKELLDRYHVPYPSESSSWQEILRLATQLSTALQADGNTDVYSFLAPGQKEPEEKLYRDIYQAGVSEGLQLINPQTLAVTVNADGWKELWESYIEAYQNGVFSNVAYKQSDNGSFKLEQGVTFEAMYKLFTDKQAGFVLADPYLFYLMRATADDTWWGITQQPGSQQAYLQIGDMYGINPSSAHTKEAWKLIEYITSDENITRKASIGGQDVGRFIGNLPARTGVLEKAVSYDLSPFYKQEPAEYGVFDSLPLPEGLYDSMYEHTIERIGAVLQGEQSVDQALTQLQGTLEASSRAAAK